MAGSWSAWPKPKDGLKGRRVREGEYRQKGRIADVTPLPYNGNEIGFDVLASELPPPAKQAQQAGAEQPDRTGDGDRLAIDSKSR